MTERCGENAYLGLGLKIAWRWESEQASKPAQG